MRIAINILDGRGRKRAEVMADTPQDAAAILNALAGDERPARRRGRRPGRPRGRKRGPGRPRATAKRAKAPNGRRRRRRGRRPGRRPGTGQRTTVAAEGGSSA